MSHLAEKKSYIVDCLNCRHYRITWDPNFPKGCRAMGFKTRQWPWMEVLRTSGETCMKFQEKPKLERSWPERSWEDNRAGDADKPLEPGQFSRMV